MADTGLLHKLTHLLEWLADFLFGPEDSGPGRSVLRLLAFVWGMVGLGLLSLLVPALALAIGGGFLQALYAIGVGLFLAGAATATGSLFGFLFGVPKSAPTMGAGAVSNPAEETRYVPNTSLETISDWLTKVIVGIGLVEYQAAVNLIARVGRSAGTAMGGTDDAIWGVIATSLLVHNLLMGFFQGFLVAYIYLPKVFDAIAGRRRGATAA